MPYAPTTTHHSHWARVLHTYQLSLGLSLNHIVLGEICSDTICNNPILYLVLPTDPTNQHMYFQHTLSSLTGFLENFPKGHPSKYDSK